MCVSNYPASVLRGVLRSTFPHTQHIQLNGPWDLQLNSIHLYLWWGGKNASLRLSLPLYLCLLIPPLLVRLKTCKPFMLLCQISCDLTRNIIQGVWQKIVVHKTWSPFVKANYWWWMSARRGQKMQKGRTLVGHTAATLRAFASLTSTSAWLYWSDLTMTVWLFKKLRPIRNKLLSGSIHAVAAVAGNPLTPKGLRLLEH